NGRGLAGRLLLALRDGRGPSRRRRPASLSALPGRALGGAARHLRRSTPGRTRRLLGSPRHGALLALPDRQRRSRGGDRTVPGVPGGPLRPERERAPRGVAEREDPAVGPFHGP